MSATRRYSEKYAENNNAQKEQKYVKPRSRVDNIVLCFLRQVVYIRYIRWPLDRKIWKRKHENKKGNHGS